MIWLILLFVAGVVLHPLGRERLISMIAPILGEVSGDWEWRIFYAKHFAEIVLSEPFKMCRWRPSPIYLFGVGEGWPHIVFLSLWLDMGLLGLVGGIWFFYQLVREGILLYRQEAELQSKVFPSIYLGLVLAWLIWGMMQPDLGPPVVITLLIIWAAAISSMRHRHILEKEVSPREV